MTTFQQDLSMPTQPDRRRLLCAAAAAACGAAMPALAQAQAQAYPSKPVRVVVAFTAGGTTDILARAVTQQLSERLRQPFVIDNKPGGGGNIGTESVVRAAPDGYTLIVNSVGPMAVNQTLYKNLSYDPLKDLVPVVQIADVPNVLVVNPSVPVKTFEEFIDHAKKNPGKLSYGSTGVGTSSHLSSYMLSQRIGADTLHVPYKGANALNDLLAGRLQFMFATIPSVIQHIRAGKLRALAVSSLGPSRSLPGVPTVAEKGFPGLFGRLLVRLLRTQGHAGIRHRGAQQERQRDPALARGADGARGCRPRRRHARAVRPIHAEGVREVESDRARLGRDAGVTLQ